MAERFTARIVYRRFGGSHVRWDCPHAHHTEAQAGVCGAGYLKRLVAYGRTLPTPQKVLIDIEMKIIDGPSPVRARKVSA